jgi:hypothetical protein
MALPKDRVSPCKCQGGWFYVNEGSIHVVSDRQSTHIPRLTRRQLAAALKLMRKRPALNRGGK